MSRPEIVAEASGSNRPFLYGLGTEGLSPRTPEASCSIKTALREAEAQNRHDALAVLSGPLYVSNRLVFARESQSQAIDGDADNVSKPILDALDR